MTRYTPQPSLDLGTRYLQDIKIMERKVQADIRILLFGKK